MGSVGQTKGAWGEDQAAQFLERKGFKIIARNFHTTRGEIDIVAKKGSDFYFVEVKTRRVGAFATDEALTHEKERRLRQAVLVYCYKNNIREDGGMVVALILVTVDVKKKTAQFRMITLS